MAITFEMVFKLDEVRIVEKDEYTYITLMNSTKPLLNIIIHNSLSNDIIDKIITHVVINRRHYFKKLKKIDDSIKIKIINSNSPINNNYATQYDDNEIEIAISSPEEAIEAIERIINISHLNSSI